MKKEKSLSWFIIEIKGKYFSVNVPLQKAQIVISFILADKNS